MALLTDLRIYIDGGDIIARTGASGDTDTHLIADTGLDLNENSGIITIYKISNPSDNKKALWSNCNDEAGTVLGVDADAVKAVLDAMVVPAGGGANISDTAYGVSWNGDTTDGASKNALYDVIETLSGGGASPIGLVEEGNGNATSGNTIWEWKNDYFVDFIDVERDVLIKTDLTSGGRYVKTTGVFVVDGAWYYHDILDIEPGDYSITGYFDSNGVAAFNEFDEVQPVISAIGTGSGTWAFTIPYGSTIKRLGICTHTAGYATFNFEKTNQTVATNSLNAKLGTGAYNYVAYVDKSTGSDSNSGQESNPFLTINKAIEGVDGRGRMILVKEGDYFETLDLDAIEGGRVVISSYGLDKVNIMGSDILGSVTKTAGRTLIYEAPFTETIDAIGDNAGYGYRIFEHGVESLEITDSERNALQRSQNYRLPYTEIKRITDQGSLSLNLDYLDALGSGIGGFWDDGTDIYIVNPAHGDVSAQEIHYAVRENTNSTIADSVNFRYGAEIELRGLNFYYSQENAVELYRFGKATLNHISIFGARLDGLSEPRTISKCSFVEAGGCGTDGIASLIYLSSPNDERNLETPNYYDNIWCHDCYDDGFSHHLNGVTSINFFLFEYNGDCGYQNITSSYNTLSNGVARENGSGIVINGGTTASTSKNSTALEGWNIVSEDNNVNFFSESATGFRPSRMRLNYCSSRNAGQYGYQANSTNGYIVANNCNSDGDATDRIGTGVTVVTDTPLT